MAQIVGIMFFVVWVALGVRQWRRVEGWRKYDLEENVELILKALLGACLFILIFAVVIILGAVALGFEVHR